MELPRSFEGYDVDSYFALVECGVIAAEDRSELLEGLLGSMTPRSPMHCAVVCHVQELLHRKLGQHTLVRTQMSFLAGPRCVATPDIAVVPGSNSDYLHRHPSAAALIVEVAEDSLLHDRATKPAMYAGAGVPAFWLVHLHDHAVECYTGADRGAHRYRNCLRAEGSMQLALPAYPHATIRAEELFPKD